MRATEKGLEPKILRLVDERQMRIRAIRPWPERAAETLWEGLLPSWIAGSNALDGSHMDLAETAQLLTGGGALPHRSLREHLEVLNHREAISEIRRLAAGRRPIRASTLRRLHVRLQAGIDDQVGGHYRRYQLERHEKSVPELMYDWEQWLLGPASRLHPVERATLAHHRVLQVQPFLDGNGRVARLTMNLCLLRDGFVPAVLRHEDRHEYRENLHRADQGEDAPLVRFVALAVERVQAMYLLALAGTTG